MPWIMQELPEGRKAIGSKWAVKLKYNNRGEIERYKGRLKASLKRKGVIILRYFLPQQYSIQEGLFFLLQFKQDIKSNSLILKHPFYMEISQKNSTWKYPKNSSSMAIKSAN